ncbi:MAG: S-methyl-5'-thioadenosine phosphorylase [Kofleriaceae bacterium]
MTESGIGIIGGSGFYDLPGLEQLETVELDTPFGIPSDVLSIGRLAGRRIVFLPRHGRGHRLLPGELNMRANVYALKLLGATHVVSISAVGSLREQIGPGDVVIPRQFVDRTVARPSTFFGDGIVAHVGLADPVCTHIADALVDAAATSRVHASGTYVCIEGPQFGTRAESELMRMWGADVVGMTNLPEARLAREAELCYGTLALVTDYDCWRARDPVNATDALAVLHANVDTARKILARALAALDPARSCACQRSLDFALVTPPEAIGVPARTRLAAILARRLGAGSHGS